MGVDEIVAIEITQKLSDLVLKIGIFLSATSL
jgi:hypothetical protein